MKIIFMGTPEFAVPSLEAVVKTGHTVSAVVTAPDKPRGRGQKVSVTPVKECAEKHAIPVLQPGQLDDPDFIRQLTELAPDLFVVVAFRILPESVYTIPLKGAFNLHASLLPKYRGAAPINWAIINGEKESGVTTFFIRKKVDTGNIILQKSIPVPDDMDAGALHDALSIVGSEAVAETVRMIEQNAVSVVPQNDSLATPAPKLFKENTRIRWDRLSNDIYNFIRGLSPYLAAWTTHRGKVIKIFKSRTVPADLSSTIPSGQPFGAIAIIDGRLIVSTLKSSIEILELQQEGKRRMTTEEFLRGYAIAENEAFE